MREFDRSRLKLKPLRERIHDLDLRSVLPLEPFTPVHPALAAVGQRIKTAAQKKAAVILMIGGHVIRSGVQNYLIDLLERGFISCIAMNGAGIIHDFEMALIGGTTESVPRYLCEGQFGLWQETGCLNDIISAAHEHNLGLGESVGQAIQNGSFPYKEISVAAAGYRCGVPLTVHVGIGYDIIHEHPNCDGAALGATSYRDFLRLAKMVENLENGVLLNFGSAVMAPEVFLKALSMARNIAHQKNQFIRNFTTLVCDLHALPSDFSKEPSKESPGYYFRPWKTLLVRSVAEKGQSFYVQDRHAHTIPALWTALKETGFGKKEKSDKLPNENI